MFALALSVRSVDTSTRGFSASKESVGQVHRVQESLVPRIASNVVKLGA